MSSSDVDLHVQYRIANAPMQEFPYPQPMQLDAAAAAAPGSPPKIKFSF